MQETKFYDRNGEFLETQDVDTITLQMLTQAAGQDWRTVGIILKEIGYMSSKVLRAEFSSGFGDSWFIVQLDFDPADKLSAEKQYSWEFIG